MRVSKSYKPSHGGYPGTAIKRKKTALERRMEWEEFMYGGPTIHRFGIGRQRVRMGGGPC